MPPSESPVSPSGESLSQSRFGPTDHPSSPGSSPTAVPFPFSSVWSGALDRLPFWSRPALLLAGGAVALDGVLHALPPGGGLVLGLGALAGGWWMLSPSGRAPSPRRASSVADWVGRCEALIPRFTSLEGHGAGEETRRTQLAQLERDRLSPELLLALVGVERPAPVQMDRLGSLAAAVQGRHPLRLQVGVPLGSRPADWSWPAGPAAADVLLFSLATPLRASELRWLETVPDGQPIWLLVTLESGDDGEGAKADLQRQWPAADPQRLLLWDGEAETLPAALAPMSDWLAREAPLLRSRTARRRIEALHGLWQADLERLRRQEWQQLQRRTQWVVAAGVLVTPLPSLDLLVMAAANGLMLREMAQLWDCPWSADQLRAAATELGKAALAQGVVEWSTQALASAVKLLGSTWLVGGALQALSAAYLTRVVGRAMADVLALAAGVSEPDLVRIRLEAPLLVARAAEEERLDWAGFLGQARRWWEGQQLPGSIS
jgi:hypothetical protein